jgi:hypothetical protein
LALADAFHWVSYYVQDGAAAAICSELREYRCGTGALDPLSPGRYRFAAPIAAVVAI